MPAPRQRPPEARRLQRRTSASAACILTAILAANQSAVMAAPSLPYLVAGPTETLRFARPRPVPAIRPPPTPPDPETLSAAHDPASENAASTAPPLAEGETPAPETASSQPGPAAPTPNEIPTPGAPGDGSGPVEILPDTYAPAPTVRLEDLLPFFTPPSSPASRATYQQK